MSEDVRSIDGRYKEQFEEYITYTTPILSQMENVFDPPEEPIGEEHVYASPIVLAMYSVYFDWMEDRKFLTNIKK